MRNARTFCILPVVVATMFIPARAGSVPAFDATVFSLLKLADAVRYPQDALVRRSSATVMLDLVVRGTGQLGRVIADSVAPKAFTDAAIEGAHRMNFAGWGNGAAETPYTFRISFIPGGGDAKPAGWVMVEMLRRTEVKGGVGVPAVTLLSTIELAGSMLHDEAMDRQMKLPDPDEFVAVEEMPMWDMAELQRRLVYPERARYHNEEGMTIVRVLIGTDGSPLKYLIDKSAGSLDLDRAAVDAVSGIGFVPARNHGIALPVWVQIPISFRLK